MYLTQLFGDYSLNTWHVITNTGSRRMYTHRHKDSNTHTHTDASNKNTWRPNQQWKSFYNLSDVLKTNMFMGAILVRRQISGLSGLNTSTWQHWIIWKHMYESSPNCELQYTADSRLALCQWVLLCKGMSHLLGTNIESALQYVTTETCINILSSTSHWLCRKLEFQCDCCGFQWQI